MANPDSLLDMSLDDIAARSRAAVALNGTSDDRKRYQRERVIKPNNKSARGRSGRHFSGPKVGTDGRWLHDMYSTENEMDIEREPIRATHDKISALGAARLLRDSTQQDSTIVHRSRKFDTAKTTAGGRGRLDDFRRRDVRGTGGASRSGVFSYRPTTAARRQGGSSAFPSSSSSGTVRISNMSYALMQDDLTELLSAIGEVERVWIDYDKFDRSSGTGGCVFVRKRDAEKAVRELHGQRICGQDVEVEMLREH